MPTVHSMIFLIGFFVNLCVLDCQEFITFSLSLHPGQSYNICFVNSLCFLCNNFQSPHYLQTRKKKKIATLHSYHQRPSLKISLTVNCNVLFIWYTTFHTDLPKIICMGGIFWLAALRNTLRIVLLWQIPKIEGNH